MNIIDRVTDLTRKKIIEQFPSFHNNVAVLVSYWILFCSHPVINGQPFRLGDYDRVGDFFKEVIIEDNKVGPAILFEDIFRNTIQYNYFLSCLKSVIKDTGIEVERLIDIHQEALWGIPDILKSEYDFTNLFAGMSLRHLYMIGEEGAHRKKLQNVIWSYEYEEKTFKRMIRYINTSDGRYYFFDNLSIGWEFEVPEELDEDKGGSDQVE